MLTAKDIMNREVITVSPGMTVEELGRLLSEKNISGAPVLEDGRLVGIVTENDLIRQNRRFHIPTLVRLFDAFIPLEGSAKVEEEIRRMSASTVSEICSKPVITVGPDTPLQDIATLMSEKGVHLLPVISGGAIVGIIGKIDIIRTTLGASDKQQS